MERKMEKIFPILGVENDCILSKSGDITVAFKVELPEMFSLSEDEYELIHQTWIKALRLLPKFTVFTKQDWYTLAKFEPYENTADSYLSKAADRHFENRSYLNHECYILLTKKPEDRKRGSSIVSNLLSPHLVPAQTINEIISQHFLDCCGQFRKVLEDSKLIRLHRLTEKEICSDPKYVGFIEKYCALNDDAGNQYLRDIHFNPEFKIGHKICRLYTLSDIEDLPSLCGSRISYDKYSTDRTKYSVGFSSSICHLLPFNHLVSQYIFIDDSAETLKKLESKRLRLQSLSTYSRENMISRDGVNDFLNEAISEQRLPVKTHINILAWSEDKAELKDMHNQISAALAQMDATAKEETAGAAQIFWAGIPGNAAEFPINDTFDTFVDQATCFFNNEGVAKSLTPDQGIRFCDRLSSRPLYIDLFDQPRKKLGITSNMGVLVCGSSGGGKSMTINHILHSLYTQGAHCVTVDIGGSYRGLCDLVKGYYFTYREDDPIKFNPFFLSDGQLLDTEKKESLKSLLFALWKQENDNVSRSEYVALSNALAGYYVHLQNSPEIFPSFNTFYEYLECEYVSVLQGHKVKDKDFDVDNFLYVLRPFYRGGEFDYLLNATENLDILNQQFIVIELDNIKDHPILFSVVTLIVVELFISKMRKLKGVRKVLTIDEAWKAIARSGMAEFLKYAFKTIRKFNGVPIVATQELDDLISSPIIKDAIINNADIKILMDMRKFLNKFDKLQDTLGMSEKAKTIALSVNKDNREIFIDVGGVIQKVYKNELCPEEYYAFTTEGEERVKVLELAEQLGTIELAIDAMVSGNHLKK